MARRLSKKKPYGKIIRGIYRRMLFSIFAAIIMVGVLRSLVQGKLGNFIAKIFMDVFSISWEEAANMYFFHVRKYYRLIIVVALVLMFLIIFRVMINGFAIYFDDIIKGIYRLADEEEEDIKLLPELDNVEKELNHVRRELRFRQKEKEKAEKRKDEMVVYLAHDIKTPLTSVIGYLELLDTAEELDEETKEHYLHIAREKSYRLEKLMNEFFEIAQSNVRPIQVSKTKVNLLALMIQVTDEAFPILQENEKEVQLDIEEDLFLEMDPEKMARVFQNLLKNAINYCQGKDIWITGKKEENYARIVFKNRGSIPEESMAHLFEKFYRVDEARQTKSGGAGLGLAISKEIVTAHGGDITASCTENEISIIICM